MMLIIDFDTSSYEVKRPLPIGKNKKSYRINES